jgi:hypothetical protein
LSRRYYSSTAAETALTATIGTSDLSFSVGALTGYPSPPFTAAIDRGNASEELVEVTSVAGNSVTVTRGVDGSAPKTHSANATFEHVTSARDFDEANAFINGGASAAYVEKAGDTMTGPLTVDEGIGSVRLRAGLGTVGTSESTTSTAFTDLATVGPDVLVIAPPSGIVRIDTICRAQVDVAGNAAIMSYQVLVDATSAVVRDASDSRAAVTRSSASVSMSNADIISGLAAGTQYRVRPRYRTGAGTSTFLDRRLIVTPVL